jgi:hypothetical protein
MHRRLTSFLGPQKRLADEIECRRFAVTSITNGHGVKCTGESGSKKHISARPFP